MAQFGCPSGAFINFAEGQIFDETKMSAMDKLKIVVWITAGIAILTIIAFLAIFEELLTRPIKK